MKALKEQHGDVADTMILNGIGVEDEELELRGWQAQTTEDPIEKLVTCAEA